MKLYYLIFNDSFYFRANAQPLIILLLNDSEEYLDYNFNIQPMKRYLFPQEISALNFDKFAQMKLLRRLSQSFAKCFSSLRNGTWFQQQRQSETSNEPNSKSQYQQPQSMNNSDSAFRLSEWDQKVLFPGTGIVTHIFSMSALDPINFNNFFVMSFLPINGAEDKFCIFWGFP